MISGDHDSSANADIPVLHVQTPCAACAIFPTCNVFYWHWLYQSLTFTHVEPDTHTVPPVWPFPPHCAHFATVPVAGGVVVVPGVAVVDVTGTTLVAVGVAVGVTVLVSPKNRRATPYHQQPLFKNPRKSSYLHRATQPDYGPGRAQSRPPASHRHKPCASSHSAASQPQWSRVSR